MMMNSTNFKQYDTRWASLGYPKKPWYIKNCGCGEVSIANCIIEMEKYKSQTPKTIQPYCVQYAAPNGNGTYFSGVPKMMEHYGLTEVKEHQTMNALWDEMSKGNRVAILLMGSRTGGTKQIHWTSSAHFVSAVAYKKSGDKHMLYITDSNSASASRNGWLSYSEYLQGDVSRVWSGKLNGALYGQKYTPSTPYAGSLPSGTVKKGSKGANVKAVQTFLNWCMDSGLSVDGNCGSHTYAAIKKWQNQYKSAYGLKADGVFGKGSIAAAKMIVAKYAPTPAPKPEPQPTPATPTIVDKLLAACKTQADWMKNSKYGYEKNPTIEKSKKKGTCVTYVSCVLQRIGILKSGQSLWHNEAGKVYGNNDKMAVIYPKNKTLSQLKGELKAGDIVMDGTGVGSNSHIFILTGKWDGNKPIIWDNHSGQQGKGAYPYSRNRKVIAIVRLK